MSAEAQRTLAAQIRHDERLLWSGRPRQGLFFRSNDLVAVPFSLMWGGFAVFWEYQVVSSGAPLLFRLWGIPFVLVGLYLIVGRFFHDAHQRARTVYGLTSQRVLIVSGFKGQDIKSLTLAGLNDISLVERDNGTGSILFGQANPAYAMWQGGSWPGMGKKLAPSFECIDDVREVFNLIRDAQLEVGKPA